MLSIDRYRRLGRINVLIKFNNLLCSRIMATKSLYPITIFLISFFIGLVPIAAALEKSNFNTNIIIGVNATIFLYIMFELLILTFRFNRNTVILQEQLIIFPISQKERYQYLLILMLRDKKNIIYLISLLIASTTFVKISIVLTIKSIILFTVFFLFLQTWLLNTYLILDKLISKNKNNAPMIFPFLLMVYILLTTNNSLSVLSYAPIIGWPGYALTKALAGQSTLLLITTSFYFLCTILGIAIGYRFLRAR